VFSIVEIEDIDRIKNALVRVIERVYRGITVKKNRISGLKLILTRLTGFKYYDVSMFSRIDNIDNFEFLVIIFIIINCIICFFNYIIFLFNYVFFVPGIFVNKTGAFIIFPKNYK